VAAQFLGLEHGFPLQQVIGHQIPGVLSGHAEHVAGDAIEVKKDQCGNGLPLNLGNQDFRHIRLDKTAPGVKVVSLMSNHKTVPHSRFSVHLVEHGQFGELTLPHLHTLA